MFEYVNPYESSEARNAIDLSSLEEMRNQFFEKLEKKSQKALFDSVLSSLHIIRDISCDFLSPSLRVGCSSDLSQSEKLDLEYILRYFIPWKKGPFTLFGKQIDSEWNSYLKWQRIKPYIGDLSGKRVADIGCHNGYFMLRMIPNNPEVVIGFDPVPKLFYNFKMLQKFIRSSKVFFEPLGVEAFKYFKSFFDKILCLGLLYHRTDPIQTLRDIHGSLKKGGEIIVDSQGISGEGSYCLFPEKKYAGARGVWFVPTKDCLINWLRRARFKEITCFYEETLSPEEQRATPWAPVASLSDYLDVSQPSLTIEGHPAPKRFYLKATK